jgi:hypothetical protein
VFFQIIGQFHSLILLSGNRKTLAVFIAANHDFSFTGSRESEYQILSFQTFDSGSLKEIPMTAFIAFERNGIGFHFDGTGIILDLITIGGHPTFQGIGNKGYSRNSGE